MAGLHWLKFDQHKYLQMGSEILNLKTTAKGLKKSEGQNNSMQCGFNAARNEILKTICQFNYQPAL